MTVQWWLAVANGHEGASSRAYVVCPTLVRTHSGDVSALLWTTLLLKGFKLCPGDLQLLLGTPSWLCFHLSVIPLTAWVKCLKGLSPALRKLCRPPVKRAVSSLLPMCPELPLAQTAQRNNKVPLGLARRAQKGLHSWMGYCAHSVRQCKAFLDIAARQMYLPVLSEPYTWPSNTIPRQVWIPSHTCKIIVTWRRCIAINCSFSFSS